MIDLGATLFTDFDDALKFNLFQILDSPLKDKLTLHQVEIEKLERRIDDSEWALLDDKKRSVASQPADNDPNWLLEQCKRLKKERQERLDTIFNNCLQKVLGICNGGELQEYIHDYSKSKSELDMYGPFVRLCNRALTLLGNIELKDLKPVDSSQWVFHVSDTKPIITTVKSKPDVVITSITAASDVAFTVEGDQSSASPEYHKPPLIGFQMRQVVCCAEFKFDKFSVTIPSEYDINRQTRFDKFDKDLNAQYEVDEDGVTLKIYHNKRPQSDRGYSSSSKRQKTITRNAASSGRIAQKTPASETNASNIDASPSITTISTTGSQSIAEGSKRSTKATSQVAQYGMEMLSCAMGTHRAITFLIHNCKLWLWYYDRQGAIQSDGIDFIQDLPRFLVLLLTFQRFGLADWGVIPELNPDALLVHNPKPDLSTARLSASRDRAARKATRSECTFKMDSLDPLSRSDNAQLQEIEIQLNDWVSNKPHCLAGRATAVLGAKGSSGTNDLVFKISFPEVARHNEGKLIDQLRRHIESDERSRRLEKHLPKVVAFGDMSRYGTQRIRSIMNVATSGARTARTMVSHKLKPLTSVDSQAFIKAWLEVVRFHTYLWKIGVEHGDPSLWNVMFDGEGKCGVLGDYDLSVLRQGERVLGTDRTGTIPFMALDLLTEKYWRGEIERQYRHELEAFIWILPFVSLRFNNGEEDINWRLDDI